MKNEIQKLIESALNEAKRANDWVDFEMPEILVEYPKSEQFGDYTTNVAMILAKKVGKNPMEIAEIINLQLTTYNLQQFEKIEVAQPGYINFYLSKKYLQEIVEKINTEKEKFGNSDKKNEKVLVEFSQPNTHKEFHIGHLRNVFIGDALVKTIKKSGSEVVAANYIGDTGTHIAKCLWGIVKFHNGEDLDKISNKAEFLGKVYSEAAQAIENNPEFEEEFKNVQKEFENGDQELVQLWSKTKKWSLDEFQKIYEKLGVSFDVYFWESEEELKGKEMLKELMGVSCIKESQGAIVADLEKYDLGVLVLVRKDGSALYGLKDIPLAVKKFKEFSIDRSIVVVDLRQSLYFKQIFKILECMGFHKDMKHVGYEFVSLKGSETMSSRKGNIIPATYLIDETVKRVKEKFPNTDVAEEIGIGALKFYMLKYSSQSKIEYDIEESVRLDGATGPYVQYAHARICNILEKAKGIKGLMGEKGKMGNVDLQLLIHEKEVSLIKELNKFPELVAVVAEDYEVHKFAHYAIKLADKFHSFYDACKVIDEGNEELTIARLSLINAVRIVLAETLDLIGVDAPEKM
ncbi:MAG TPA: arginine--tRNA ligase [Candidatus Moranbacteria bacterium]|nr:arginine--tRNA ligase [Candidatus Moranbacteria bacterium]HBT45575.1 arginine--tRNA ligase [Candidatus Moranbacteria bacterium]